MRGSLVANCNVLKAIKSLFLSGHFLEQKAIMSCSHCPGPKHGPRYPRSSRRIARSADDWQATPGECMGYDRILGILLERMGPNG